MIHPTQAVIHNFAKSHSFEAVDSTDTDNQTPETKQKYTEMYTTNLCVN